MTGNSGQDDNIRVKRRRQGASSGPQSGERAEMPPRQRPESGGPRPSYSGSGGTGSAGGGSIPGLGGAGCSKLPLWLIVLLVIGFIAFSLISDGMPGGQVEDPFQSFPTEAEQPFGGVVEEPEEIVPTATKRPTATRSAQGAVTGQKWTVMLYQDADDQILEQDIYLDLNEVERVGSSDRVQIVSQIDRYRGAYTGDGNWVSTRRYYITQDDDLQTVNSDLVEDLGEANMADGDTLADFITWAAENYPADKYVLILSDHGMGWPGGFSDPAPGGRDSTRAPLASALGDDQLYMMELEQTLDSVLRQANIDKFEIIGMDACLMGHLEVLAGLEPYARYAVLSQETEPSLGWAYASFMQDLVDNPDMDGAEVSQRIVDSYIDDDQRINDDKARAEFLRQGSPMGGLFGAASQISAASLARQLSRNVTLTAIDLAAVPDLITSVNALAYNLQREDPDMIASARSYAPSFTNIFGKNTPSPYIDLGGFVQMLKRGGLSAQSRQAADAVLANLQASIVAEKHGEDKSGATGVSIYFPNSTLYRSPVAGPQSYNIIAERFAEVSLWDDFLIYYYNDVPFKPEPAAPVTPSSSIPSRSPGLGEIEVSPISLSSKTAAPGDPVTLTTQISGKNIGYIYLFVGFYDQASNAIFKADTDYLESPDTRELNGVYYPQWNANEPFTMTFEWEPTLFQITDGETPTVALFTPQTYGASAEDAVYTVDGIYHYADGTSRSARLYFRNGVMQQVFGFTDEEQTGGVREIIPQAGDTFTILDKWLDLDASGQVTDSVSQEGAVLTFGSQPFEWKEVYAAEGNYVVGFIVQDLDGNTQEVYTTVTVQ